MDDRYADYDVLAKRQSLSWNEPTRAALDARAALEIDQAVLTESQLMTLATVKRRVCPEFPGRAPTSTLAMVVDRIARDEGDGTRHYLLPATAECWRRGLDAIEGEARERLDKPFMRLGAHEADAILTQVQQGQTLCALWADLPPQIFWRFRLIPDLVAAHWAQPQAWSAMGFGGPASPRGYVRLAANRRDPWEANEAGDAPRFGWPRRQGGRA